MSAKPLTDLSQLCIHTITTKPWNIEEAAKNFAAEGVKGITVWRDALANRNIKQTGQLLRDHELNIVSLCRGGFFPDKEKEKRQTAINDNLKAIEEAFELGAPLIVLVCGADPSQSLEDSRKQIKDGIEIILPQAAAAKIKLAIEPLHPMYADTRSAINTLAQANDMAAEINSPYVGVAVDVYHLWWDPFLEDEIKRCGKNAHLFAFHINGRWLYPGK
jgi:sugar phosphate isomerase/epimerase